MNRRVLLLMALAILLALLGWSALHAFSTEAQTSATETPMGMATITATLAAPATSLTSTITSTAGMTGTTAFTSTAAESGASEALLAFQGALEDLYTRVNPSVVNVTVVESAMAGAAPGMPDNSVPPFGQAPGNEIPRQGSGSGFVWDTQGHIVTNNHVVQGASRVTVGFSDGTVVTATVVGTDSNSDLAVLKVNAPAELLRPVSVGDSARLRVGQFVVAIGDPFGLQGSMTTGIVSALARSLPAASQTTLGGSYSIPDVIQTDAAINPGNSGGVLVDASGQLIGVTAAIASLGGSGSGVGFAIPAAIVQKVVPALISEGNYRWPWLGISGTSLTPDLAASMNLSDTQRGALVVSVVPGGPAEAAGLRGSSRQTTVNGFPVRVGGDVITAINGQPVRTFDDLVTYLARSGRIGEAVTLTILRDGQKQTVEVTLGARPSGQVQAPAAQATPGAQATPSPEASPTVESTPTTEASPTVEVTPTVEATPSPEATATAVLTATVEPTATTEVTATVEPMATTEVTLTVEPMATTEVTLTVEPTATVGVTATTEMTSTSALTATIETTPTVQATPPGGPRLGVLVMNMTPTLAQAMGLPSGQQGVLIERVNQGSPADRAGLRGSFRAVTVDGSQVLVGGDVITGFNGQPVNDISDLQAGLRQATPGGQVTLTILRDGNEQQVTVVLAQGAIQVAPATPAPADTATPEATATP